MALVKNCFRGFAGGPDFNTQQAITFLLEDVEFRLKLPVSNIVTEEPPRDINHPFRRKGWFEENLEQHRQHLYAHVYTEIWYYLPPVTIMPDSEYGQLSLSIWLKRVPAGVNALDREALAATVSAEYDQHYNSPTIGEADQHGIGVNTKIRKKVAAQSAARTEPFSDAFFAREVELRIESYGAPPIAPAEVVSLHGEDWVFYREDNPKRTRYRQDFYCLPLDERYYLQLGFTHRVDRSDKKAWQKHANQAQQRIMDSISVKNIA